jgi:hypothetical protein
MADQGQQPVARPAGWMKDPSGRHFGRWWDSQQWTENVISAEKVQSIDPCRPGPSLPCSPTPRRHVKRCSEKPVSSRKSASLEVS